MGNQFLPELSGDDLVNLGSRLDFLLPEAAMITTPPSNSPLRLERELAAARTAGEYAVVWRGRVVERLADQSEALRRYYKLARTHQGEFVEFVPPTVVPQGRTVVRGYRGNRGRRSRR